MSRPTAPTVTIALDKERELLFDFNALAKAEEVTGKSLFSDSVWDDLSVTLVRALLWAGLLHEDPELTLEQVGAMLHMGNMQDVVGPIKKAFALSTPEREEGKAPLAGKKKREAKSP